MPADAPPRSPRRPAVEEVAEVAQRLAVLLAAGIPPPAAWEYLAEPVDDTTHAAASRTAPSPLERPRTQRDRVIVAAAKAARRGGDVPRAIAVEAGRVARPGRLSSFASALGPRSASMHETTRKAWCALAAAVQVATDTGAPLAEVLRDLAASLRDAGQAERDRQTALAGPRATARTVLALPVVGILFGVGLGFDTLHVLFATPPGLGCLGAGIALMIAAQAWNRALLRRAAPSQSAPGLAVELVAIGMSGGGSAPDAVARATAACDRFGLAQPSAGSVSSVLGLAQRAGAGAGELLLAEAEQERRDARSAAQEASASLSVRLMAPLAVCVLPAFMLVSVAPLVLSILSSTIGGLR